METSSARQNSRLDGSGIRAYAGGVARWLEFPNPVDEVSARLVAAGVVLLTAAILLSGAWWLLAALGFGFVARVLSGPRLSPL